MKVFRVEHNYMHFQTELAMNLLQTTPGYQLSVSSVFIPAMPAGSPVTTIAVCTAFYCRASRFSRCDYCYKFSAYNCHASSFSRCDDHCCEYRGGLDLAILEYTKYARTTI